MHVNSVIQAKVTSIHEYGIYIEAEGIVGFIQVTNLSWRRGAKPAEVAAVDENIEVYVLAVHEAGFSASIKDVHPELDPWRDASEFEVGSAHDGIVVRVLEWGFFVKIRPDVEGLVFGRSDVEVGDQIFVVVSLCISEQRKLEFIVRT